MRLTTKGRFAVTAMLDLTLHGDSGAPVTLNRISERQQISISYLEQLFAKLRKRGLVKSLRGPNGGYALARAPEGIRISEIVTAVDEALDATQCAGRSDCQDGKVCMTHELWMTLTQKMLEYLDSVSLATLAQRERLRRHRGEVTGGEVVASFQNRDAA